MNEETFIASEDKKGLCDICGATKEYVKSHTSGLHYWKYAEGVKGAICKKHKWIRV